MTYKNVLLGLSAIGAVVVAGSVQAQTVGVTGVVVAPTPAVPAMPAVPPKAAMPAERVAPATPPATAATGTDVSGTANAAASFAIGTVVRDSTGAQIGTVMDPKEGMATDGRVAIKTGTGFVTVPAASLRLDGGVAISNQTAADIGAGARSTPQ